MIQAILSKLKVQNLANDEEFAVWFIQERIKHRPRSRLELIYELANKGISRPIIERALKQSSYDELESLKKLITKHRKHKDDQQLISYLKRKGFSLHLIQSCLTN